MIDAAARGLAAKGLGLITTATAPYIPVATRNNLLQNGLSNGTDTGTTFRTTHTIGTALGLVRDIRLAFGNWYVNSITETVGPNDITIATSIEIGGFRFPLTFNGAATVTIKPGQAVVTDTMPGLIAGVWAPGTIMTVCTFVSCTSGGKWPVGLTTSASLGEGGNANGGDATLTGTIATSGVFAYSPFAIFGQPTAAVRSFGLVGDSIMTGQGDAFADRGFASLALQNLGYGYHKVSKPGDVAYGFAQITNSARRRGQLASLNVTDVIEEYGVNDVVQARTFAQISGAKQTIWTALRAAGVKRIYATTITPVSASTDNWATLANQTPNANSAVLQAVNAWLRAGADGGIDGLIDLNALADSGGASAPTGKWIVTGVANATTVDGTHPSTSTHTTIFAPAVQAVIR